MTITNTEFETILQDESKRIVGDPVWVEDEDHSPSVEFRVEVTSDTGWPLFVRGSYNPLIPALSCTMILKTAGRVYVAWTWAKATTIRRAIRSVKTTNTDGVSYSVTRKRMFLMKLRLRHRTY